MPTIFLQVTTDQPHTQKNKKTKEEKKKISFFLIFHRFQPFNCCLSVVLSLDEGDFPENVHIVGPGSFEPFCVWILF